LKGEICEEGLCIADPCDGVHCGEGKVCAVSAGVGVCVDNMCASLGCDPYSICCGGGCVADPCQALHCPAGSKCLPNDLCHGACVSTVVPTPMDQVVGAGGGGLSCAMSAGARTDPGGATLLLLALVGAAVVARRGRTREGR
jgi:hypothetical protein